MIGMTLAGGPEYFFSHVLEGGVSLPTHCPPIRRLIRFRGHPQCVLALAACWSLLGIALGDIREESEH